MADRTIQVAVWEYRNAAGKRRRGYFGQTLDIPEDEIARGDREGAFDQPKPEGEVPFTLPQILPMATAPEGEAGGLDDEPADDAVIATGDQGDDGNAGDQAGAQASPAVAADGTAVPEMPRKTALVAEWREYAVARGMSAEEADKLTRDELKARFA